MLANYLQINWTNPISLSSKNNMNKAIYEGVSLDNCLEQASKKLKLPKGFLESKIISSTGIFRKKLKVEIWINGDKLKKVSGKAKVENGKILIKNPEYRDNYAVIHPCPKARLVINGKLIEEKINVRAEDEITVEFDESKAKRNVAIKISDTKLVAYLTIDYIPHRVFKLKDREETNELYLEEEIVKEEYPPMYTKEEIIDLILGQKINNSTINENLNYIIQKRDIKNLKIAEGKAPVNGVDDVIKINYKDSKKNIDENERIDFRNLNSISNVDKDQVIGELIEGRDGECGEDVFGNVILHKKRKIRNIEALRGCYIEDNKVISLVKGRPHCTNGIFYVDEILQSDSDVDMRSGNLNFIGGIEVFGDVKPGMEVNAGGDVIIGGTVDSGKISSGGNVLVRGSVLNSKVEAGGEEAKIAFELDILNSFREGLKNLMETAREIQEHKLLGLDRTDGEIIKVLMEKKFKNIERYCMEILNFNVEENNNYTTLVKMIKSKLMGLAPVSIKHFSELEDIKNEIDIKKLELQSQIDLNLTVQIPYVQDSEVISSDAIIVYGKGVYTSKIRAKNSVVFSKDGSVIRGGSIQANNLIKCKHVGSLGGVKTQLIVGKQGKIYAERAYENTVFTVGEKEHILNEAARSVEVYLDKYGQIIVEKLKL